MKNRIVQYNRISTFMEEPEKERIANVHKGYLIELEMLEKGIQADVYYLIENLRRGERGWPRLLGAFEKKVEGHSKLVNDFLEKNVR